MVVSLDLVSLILYAVQQLGIMLGVGAQTILLITYAISVRDGVVDAKESQIARAVTKAIVAGLGLIVLSGGLIVAMHFMAGQWYVLLAPAFLFKWLLIAFLIVTTFLWRKKPFPDFVWEGIMGGTWYALFVLHIIAPVATWFDLVVLYVVWTAGFLLVWSASIFMTHKKESKGVGKLSVQKSSGLAEDGARLSAKPISPAPLEKKVEEKKPEPKPVPPPPPPAPKKEEPKPVPPPPPAPPVKIVPPPVNLPVIKPDADKKVLTLTPVTTVLPPHPPVASMPTIEKVEKPVPMEHPGLPAIKVMPRTKEDLDKHI